MRRTRHLLAGSLSEPRVRRSEHGKRNAGRLPELQPALWQPRHKMLLRTLAFREKVLPKRDGDGLALPVSGIHEERGAWWRW